MSEQAIEGGGGRPNDADTRASELGFWAISRDERTIPPLRDKVSHLSSQVLAFAFGAGSRAYVAIFIVCLSEKPTRTWPLLSTSAAGDSFSSRISYSDAQATHAVDAQLIPARLDQTPTHSHSSNSKVSDEYRNIFCELRRPATCRPR
jgi:hypothetical protein